MPYSSTEVTPADSKRNVEILAYSTEILIKLAFSIVSRHGISGNERRVEIACKPRIDNVSPSRNVPVA